MNNDVDFTLADYIGMVALLNPPADYDSWFRLLCSCKAAGVPYDAVDAMNRRDPEHYNAAENKKHWDSISPGGPITPALLVKLAHNAGWVKRKATAYAQTVDPATRNDLKSSYSNGYSNYSSNTTSASDKYAATGIKPVAVPMPNASWNPVADAIAFIQSVFAPTDTVRIVTHSRAREKSDGSFRYDPADAGTTYAASDLVHRLSGSATLEDAIGPYDYNAGVWIGINPTTAGGKSDVDVTAYRSILVECDDDIPAIQYGALKQLNLPCRAITNSGGKSLHALVPIPEGVSSPEDYAKLACKLYDRLEEAGIHPDRSCRNAGRLTRLPGAKRGSQSQYLIAAGVPGASDWTTWMKLQIKNMEIDVRFGAPGVIKTLEPSATVDNWLWDGVIHPHEMTEIIGRSKAGKSLFALQMSICMVTGMPFLGRACKKGGKLLYVNLEISAQDMHDRLASALRKLNLQPIDVKNLLVWTLRGKDADPDLVIDAIITKARAENISYIVIDPMYILFAGSDENDNSSVSLNLRKLQSLIEETGCGITILHHISDKIADTNGFDINQLPSGASAFSRMYDVLLALEPIRVREEIPVTLRDGNEACRIRIGTRNGKTPDPISVWKSPPLYLPDRSRLLRYCRLLTSSDLKADDKSLAAEFDQAVKTVGGAT